MWTAEMPSNIALIKYMGKNPGGKNIPANASLSLSLKHLKTKVNMEESKKSGDIWIPLKTAFPFHLKEQGRKRYLGHLRFLKEHFGIDKHFQVSSGNNFPADSGIASSASSFAALTECACRAFSELSGKSITQKEKALLSAKGSGSSCRSFFNEWVLWDGEHLKEIPTHWNHLHHMAVIAGTKAKDVPSSMAHERVKTSPLYEKRVPRAEKRLEEFLEGLKKEDWERLYMIAWAEFYDMHALFETSLPPFGYFLPKSIYTLQAARETWKNNGDGPIVTMDAGPNVHLLWRPEQTNQAMEFFERYLKGQVTTLTNIEDIGFAKV